MVNAIVYLLVFENKLKKDINRLGRPSTYIPGGGTRNLTVNENTSNSISNADSYPVYSMANGLLRKTKGPSPVIFGIKLVFKGYFEFIAINSRFQAFSTSQTSINRRIIKYSSIVMLRMSRVVGQSIALLAPSILYRPQPHTRYPRCCRSN